MFGSIFDSKKTDAPVPDVVEERKKPPGTLLTHEDRLDILIKDASARAPPQLAELLLKARPIITPAVVVLIKVVNVVGPLYVGLFTLIYKFLAALPWDLFQAAMGLGLCFFGGGYCASIAAVPRPNRAPAPELLPHGHTLRARRHAVGMLWACCGHAVGMLWACSSPRCVAVCPTLPSLRRRPST